MICHQFPNLMPHLLRQHPLSSFKNVFWWNPFFGVFIFVYFLVVYFFFQTHAQYNCHRLHFFNPTSCLKHLLQSKIFLEFFMKLLRQNTPRKIRALDTHKAVIFTDAYFERNRNFWPCRLGGLFFFQNKIQSFSLGLDLEMRAPLGELTKKQICKGAAGNAQATALILNLRASCEKSLHMYVTSLEAWLLHFWFVRFIPWFHGCMPHINRNERSAQTFAALLLWNDRFQLTVQLENHCEN